MIIQRTVIDPITGTAILVGEGLPFGTDAPTGSLFVRKDGGSNQMLFVKYGNTTGDWQVLASGSGTAISSSYALSASYAVSASISQNSISSSYAVSSSRAQSSVSASNMSGYIVRANNAAGRGIAAPETIHLDEAREYKDEDVWSALRYTQMASANPQIWVYERDNR